MDLCNKVLSNRNRNHRQNGGKQNRVKNPNKKQGIYGFSISAADDHLGEWIDDVTWGLKKVNDWTMTCHGC